MKLCILHVVDPHANCPRKPSPPCLSPAFKWQASSIVSSHCGIRESLRPDGRMLQEHHEPLRNGARLPIYLYGTGGRRRDETRRDETAESGAMLPSRAVQPATSTVPFQSGQNPWGSCEGIDS